MAKIYNLVDSGTNDKKLAWCQRDKLLVFLVATTMLSCMTSIATAILYFCSSKDNTRIELTTSPVSSSAVQPNYDASRHFVGPQYNSSDPQSPAYAHKVLFMDFKNLHVTDSQRAGQNYVLSLNPDHNHSAFELSRGVTLVPHGIKIVFPGTYFIYKSIYFTPFSRMKCESLQSESFTSLLILNSTLNSGGITTLLQSIHTCCPTCRDHSETAFSGGVFYLEQRDIIQVEVTGDEWIDVERDVTYVGLMKLGVLR